MYFSPYASKNEKLNILQIFKPLYVILAILGLFPCSIEFPKGKQDFIVKKSSKNLLCAFLTLTTLYIFCLLHFQDINAESQNDSYTESIITKWNYIIEIIIQLVVCTTLYICAFLKKDLYVSILNEIAHAWAAFPVNRKITLGQLRVNINCVVLGCYILTLVTMLTIANTGIRSIWKLILVTQTFIFAEMLQFTMIAFYYCMILMVVALLKNIKYHCRMLKNFDGCVMETVMTLRQIKSVYLRVLRVKRLINTVSQTPILLMLAHVFQSLVSDPHALYHGLVFQTTFDSHDVLESTCLIVVALLKIYVLARSGALLQLQVLKIGQTIHNIPNNVHKDITLYMEVQHFSTVINYHDAEISIYGIFSLGAPLLYNMIASATLYLIILVQFDKSN